STTRTETRATRTRRRASRRCSRPTTSCQTPRSASSTTTGRAPSGPATPARRSTSATSTSETSSAGSSAAAPAPARTGGASSAGSAAPKVCPQCNGSGVVATSQGLFALQQPCPNCRGMGTVVDTPCPTCHGSGRERRTKRYTVRIPAGVKDGTRIKLKGKGEAGFGGAPAGDLYVVTRVEPSKLYERRGDDLVIDVPVTFDEAALGAEVEIPTPDGRVSLKVPAGSADGKLLRVKGRG